MKKKILFFILIVILLSIGALFFSKNISNGCGMVPCQYFEKCLGFYIQTFDDRALDGGVGGKCFGVVKKIKNEKYEETMKLILGGVLPSCVPGTPGC